MNEYVAIIIGVMLIGFLGCVWLESFGMSDDEEKKDKK